MIPTFNCKESNFTSEVYKLSKRSNFSDSSNKDDKLESNENDDFISPFDRITL